MHILNVWGHGPVPGPSLSVWVHSGFLAVQQTTLPYVRQSTFALSCVKSCARLDTSSPSIGLTRRPITSTAVKPAVLRCRVTVYPLPDDGDGEGGAEEDGSDYSRVAGILGREELLFTWSQVPVTRDGKGRGGKEKHLHKAGPRSYIYIHEIYPRTHFTSPCAVQEDFDNLTEALAESLGPPGQSVRPGQPQPLSGIPAATATPADAASAAAAAAAAAATAAGAAATAAGAVAALGAEMQVSTWHAI